MSRIYFIGRETGPVFRDGATKAGSGLAESRAEQTRLGSVLPKQQNANFPGESHWLAAFLIDSNHGAQCLESPCILSSGFLYSTIKAGCALES
jgi:hypothetical protein